MPFRVVWSSGEEVGKKGRNRRSYLCGCYVEAVNQQLLLLGFALWSGQPLSVPPIKFGAIEKGNNQSNSRVCYIPA